MTSKAFLIFVSLILQCGLVFSHASLMRTLNVQVKRSSIPLSELAKEFRDEQTDFLDAHYSFMIMAAGSGDRLYDLSTNLSRECSRTIRASILIMEALPICEETNSVMDVEVEAAVQELQKAHHLDEHPLEIVCRKIEENYARNLKLKPSFEKVKMEVTKSNFIRRGPPYSHEVLKTLDGLASRILEKLRVPELARIVAVTSFVEQFNISHVSRKPYHYFAKSCQSMAKSGQFSEPLQKCFGKALDDAVTEITVDDPLDHIISSFNLNGQWWMPKLVKSFYSCIAENPILKRELESTSKIVGEGARKEDLDFSKF